MSRAEKIRKRLNMKSSATADVLKQERMKSANSFLDISLVVGKSLEPEYYDYNTVVDICALLYSYTEDTILKLCYLNLEDNIKYAAFNTTKVQQAFKAGKIVDMFDIVTDSLIPTKYTAMDEMTKTRIMRILLGYFLFREVMVEKTNRSVILERAIALGINNMLTQYTFKFAKQKRGVVIDIEEMKGLLGVKPIPQKGIEVKLSVFKDVPGVKHGEDIIKYFNAYIESYLANVDEDGELDEVAEERLRGIVPSENVAILVDLGRKSMKEEDILLLAKEKLSDELFKYYSELVVNMKTEYYRVTGSMREFIAQKVLEQMLKEEREEQSKKLVETTKELHQIQAEVKTLRRTTNKAEKDLEVQKALVISKEAEIAKLSNATCKDEDYKKLQAELEKKNKENSKLAQENQKLENRNEGAKTRIAVLEDKIKEFEDLTGNLVELQQDNILLQQELEQVEDLLAAEEEGTDDYEMKLAEIKDKKIQFIGGTGDVGARLKELFPNSEYFDITEKGRNFNVAETVECIVIYTKMMTHAHTTRAQSLAKGRPVIPVNVLNTRLIVDTIYKQLNGHK